MDDSFMNYNFTAEFRTGVCWCENC